MITSRGKYKQLIVKYLQGEVDAYEKVLVESWISKSVKNKKLFESYKGLLILTKKDKATYDTEKAWKKVEGRILTNAINTSSFVPDIGTNARRLSHVILYATSGIAAMILITIGFVTLADRDIIMKQYSSGYEVSMPHTLPDGSIIELNQNTTIKYPDKFNKRAREISIFGEAFFEIKPDSKKPFIVHSAGLNIKVLGTKFNVKAYPGQETIKVLVSSGTVLVYPNNVKYGEELGYILTEGGFATYNKRTGELTKGNNDDLNSISWKTGVLTFKETPLRDVFKALEERYNKKFLVENKELLDKRLTARFEDLSFEDALHALALIFEIEYESEEDQVRVY